MTSLVGKGLMCRGNPGRGAMTSPVCFLLCTYVPQVAREATAQSLNPVRIKKLYVLAALLVMFGPCL